MITLKRQKGNAAEELAANYLKKNSYKILARNYTAREGEIDIIASCRKTLVFVEVKARATNAYGGGAAAVTASKQNKITKTALAYIREHKPAFDALMFDIIAVTDGKIEHIKNAFAVEGYIV